MSQVVARTARQAGIIDVGSAAPRPLEQRLLLAAAKRVRVVVGSCADGEPLVATARRAAVAFPTEIARGLELAVAATGARSGVLAVERRARDAVEALSPFAPVITVADVARCGDAADLALDAAGVHVPPGADAVDHGALVLDAQALLALGRGAPVIDRVVTVTGDVARPGVGLVPIGTSIDDLVAAAGGATCGPAWVALGDGPLAGRPLDRDDVVTAATRAIFVGAAGSELVRRARRDLGDSLRRSLSACEQCAMCSDACPPRLLGGRLHPHELVRALSRARVGWEEMAAAVECSACGLCDVACPSGLSPRELIAATARAVSDRGPVAPHAGLPHEQRSERRLSLSLVALRLGLSDLPDISWQAWAVAPAQVALPLKQSLGAAARPEVAPGARVVRGARLAGLPDDAPGVPVHASIDGVVTEIARGAVVISAASPPPAA